MRWLTVMAATLRGWVQPILPSTPRPASRHILGICVVFPEPVSPVMMTTGFLRIASTMSARLAAIGRASGMLTRGRLFLRLSFFAAAAASFLSSRAIPCASSSGFLIPCSFPISRSRPTRSVRMAVWSFARRRFNGSTDDGKRFIPVFALKPSYRERGCQPLPLRLSTGQ